MSKSRVRITALHYGDLQCAALNFGADGQAIWDDLHDRHEFEVDAQQQPGVFYSDFSTSFMYPHGAAEARKQRRH